MREINYSQYCTYRLPCGVCTRTNSYCPLFSGTIDVTWIAESTSVIANSVAEPALDDAVPVIRCKDCKHRPTIDGEYENGFSIIFPDMICPCQCDDGWYNWMPEDDWYCGNAQEKTE